jgi:hypothetical protein
MQRCPNCQRIYYDDLLEFCGRDGSPLMEFAPVSPFAGLPITPSEIVLLFGEQFAPVRNGSFTSGVAAPISGVVVETQPLITLMISAAVLACEQAGALYLQMQSGIFISAGPVLTQWPQGSFEYQLCEVVKTGPKKLWYAIGSLWQRNFPRNPVASWVHGRTLVLQGLKARNLVQGDFSSCQVWQPLTQLPREQTVDAVRRLFDEGSKRQPLWGALQGDIQKAIFERANRSVFKTF